MADYKPDNYKRYKFQAKEIKELEMRNETGMRKWWFYKSKNTIKRN